MNEYTHFFGCMQEPFRQDIALSELYALPGLESFIKRFDYCLRLRGVSVLTGKIGSGKSKE